MVSLRIEKDPIVESFYTHQFPDTLPLVTSGNLTKESGKVLAFNIPKFYPVRTGTP